MCKSPTMPCHLDIFYREQSLAEAQATNPAETFDAGVRAMTNDVDEGYWHRFG